MGIIKAITSSIKGSLGDQWLEVIEPCEMSDTTVFTSGVTVRPSDSRNGNRSGTAMTVSNGSVIHVYPNQFMMLLDGGKIVDYTAEPGYYTVNNSSLPSMFSGPFGDSLKETFGRFKFSGVTPTKQCVYYINLQEIKGIKFGTRNPITYFDTFYNADLSLRAHGTYSIKITDPILFYMEAIPRNRNRVDITEINEQYLTEFMTALQAAINQLSIDGVHIFHVPAKGMELSRYMSDILDEEWNRLRGFMVQSVGIASISYSEDSQKIINERNKGAILSDPAVLNAYVQSTAVRGIEKAGENAAGALSGFMGLGVSMNAGNGIFSNGAVPPAPRTPSAPAAADRPAADTWTCACGAANTGNYCAQCGQPRPQPKASGSWTCSCGAANTGKFCSECGKPRPGKIKCDKCGFEPDPNGPIPKFCPECGDPITDADRENGAGK